MSKSITLTPTASGTLNSAKLACQLMRDALKTSAANNTTNVATSNKSNVENALISNERIELDINRANLSELSQVKESDILEDDNESISLANDRSHSINTNSHYNNQIKFHTTNRSSPSASNSYSVNSLKISNDLNQIQKAIAKKRNLSASSSVNEPQRIFLTSPLHSTNKLFHPNGSNGQNVTNLYPNHQQLKMHHIEDALASVLDDMKQLDFSTSFSNTTPPSQYQNQLMNNSKINTPTSQLKNGVSNPIYINNNNNCNSNGNSNKNKNNNGNSNNTLISSSSSSTPTSSSSLSSALANSNVANRLTNKKNRVNFVSAEDLSSSENSSDETSLINKKKTIENIDTQNNVQSPKYHTVNTKANNNISSSNINSPILTKGIIENSLFKFSEKNFKHHEVF